MKVRRFFYITAPKGAVVHRSEGRISGGLMFCGRPIRSGWRYYVQLRTVPKNRTICAQCS